MVASDSIRLIMRGRSAFVAIDASSLRADFFIRRLYLATSFEVLNDVLERIVRFLLPSLNSLNVADVFRKCGFDGLVHQLGNAAIGFSRFQTLASLSTD